MIQNNLFQVLPENFFVPLSSPNRIAYWDCIMKLFTVMSEQLSFGIEREILTDELQFYFEQNMSAGFQIEDESSKDPRAKANAMLRNLENYGWIEIETDKSYIQRVNFNEYAVNIIKTLTEVAEGKKLEYQGYIYVVYSLVRGKSDHPGVVLQQIRDNTDMLITGLKNLNSNIKHYIDELTRHKTVSEIMDALFNDYITNIVDRAYHRLRTSDNVAKFRPEIIEKLETMSRSKDYIKRASDDIAELREINKEAAVETVYQYLHEIAEAYRNMDEILQEIDRKNTQYQRAAINRARFLLSGSEDVRGQIKEILMYMNDRINENSYDLNGIYELEYTDDLIRLFGSTVIDEKSFYTPTEGRREFKAQELENVFPDEEMRQDKIRRMSEKMMNVLSAERINRYVASIMGDRDYMSSGELPINSPEDFMKVIYTRLYGVRKSMSYVIEKTDRLCSYNGYVFPEFIIKKKRGKNL